MKKNIEILTSKLFKNESDISINKLKKIKADISKEILYFKFHSLKVNKDGSIPPSEFGKSIFSNLAPRQAYQKILTIDEMIKNKRIKDNTSFQDFVLINKFFNEYEKYFTIHRTSNYSRECFKNAFHSFEKDFDSKLENETILDNLFNIIDYDMNGNLEFDEMKTFLFRANTGGRSDRRNQETSIKPWLDLKANLGIYKQKLTEIIKIIKR